ncbi:hypothetical protein MRX96_018028 [Rhipicephalus microplus]
MAQRCTLPYEKDATLVGTIEAIETATDVWDSTEAILVLHAGLSDIQDDTSPHDSTEKIKSQITSWKARAKGHFFVVYGVPEVGPKDDTMRIMCELWNQNLRQNCSDIGTRVEFVSVTKALQIAKLRHPEIRHHSSNLQVTDLAAHLTTHMQELFNPTHDESTSAVNGDPDEPHQPSEEDH